MNFKPSTHTQRLRAIGPTKGLDDNLDRLTLAEYTIDESNEIFTIDDLGNRTSVNVRDGNNVAYSVDNLTNRYNSVGGNSLTYDKAGNLTTEKDGYEYEYDYENHILKIGDSNSSTVAEFAYDALGRRIRKIDSLANETTLYYYNYNWQVLCEYNGSGTQKRFYIYGNYIDEVLFMYRFSPIARCYYVHDHLYSPAALIDNSGSVCERYEYDAYGNPYILEPNFADDPDGQSDYGNPYLFTGRQADFLDGGNLLLQDNRHRYYDYYTGRWLTHDLLGITPNPQKTNTFDVLEQYANAFNLYEYVKSNPMGYADSFGLAVNCGVTTHRSPPRIISWWPLRISVGHDWLEYPGGSMGWWPSGSEWFSDGIVERPDFYGGYRSGTTDWGTVKSESCDRKLEYGSGKGKKCKCAITLSTLDCRV